MNFTDKITVNTQSSIRIELDKIIRIDPYVIDGEPHDADVVFITHPHFDHFSPEDLKKVIKPDTVIYLPESAMEKATEFGAAVKPVNAGQEITLCDIKIKVIPSYNTNKPNHLKEFGWVGYIFEIPFEGSAITLYAAGDTDVIPEQDTIRCDVAMIPVGGTYTMDEKEAAMLINRMKPGCVIPIHYGSVINDPQTGDRFAALVDKEIPVIKKLFT